jgi:CHAD domain-containing protein
VEAERYGETRLRGGDDPEAVHDTRVAVRRVRSLLRVFPALNPGDGLGERLRVWSGALGDVRDLEVLRGTLESVCPAALWERLRPELDAEHAAAALRLMAEVDSAEHRDVMEELRELALRHPDDKLHVGRGVRTADAKARRRLAEGDADPEMLHRARKAAKRARYAAEAVGDKDLAAEHKAVQDALGAHHDCAVALERLDGVDGAEVEAAREALRRRAAEALDALSLA